MHCRGNPFPRPHLAPGAHFVEAKSTPFGTPCGGGHSSLRSLASPLPNEPAALGFVGGPVSCSAASALPCHARVGRAAGSPRPPIRPGTRRPSVRRSSWVPGLTSVLAPLRVYARASLSRSAPSATASKPLRLRKTAPQASVRRLFCDFTPLRVLPACSRALRASLSRSRWTRGRVAKTSDSPRNQKTFRETVFLGSCAHFGLSSPACLRSRFFLVTLRRLRDGP